jgi:N-acylglucosamine 2-epimerase
MMSLPSITSPSIGAEYFRSALLEIVIPFWLRHGLDEEFGGMLTSLDRDGALLDGDKSVWFQGRAGWMFATLYNEVAPNAIWLAAAQSCVDFSLKHCHSETGKMYFSVTRSGQPLRMRRYVYSESFAAISYAATAKAAGKDALAAAAWKAWDTYLDYSFTPGKMQPKSEATRPCKGLGPLMIGLNTAHELQKNLGDAVIRGKNCAQWIEDFITEIERDFYKPELGALMEVVSPDGSLVEGAEGRTLNPGHAMECAWFLMQAGAVELGLKILDCMWDRGWDRKHGGLLYFTDLHNKPVQEYWHDMKFWWPHCEAMIASLMALKLTGNTRYAAMHQQVAEWSHLHFADEEFGEWYGYVHRDGRLSQPAKGNLFKGPFHLPRMLLMCWKMLETES